MASKLSTERVSDEYLVLNSCGIEKFSETDGVCNRPNGRVDYHIIYVAEGICHAEKNSEVIKVPSGNVIFFPPGKSQKYSFYKQDMSVSYYVHFTGLGCENIFKQLGIFGDFITYIGKNIRFEEIFERMSREYCMKLPSFEICCSGMLLELFSVISRYSHIKKPGQKSSGEEMILDACRRISNNLDSVNVSDLAARFFLSKSRFSHIFREITGKAPQEYITELKIAKACDMLINTDFSINHVASSAGYSDQNYFSRIFKKKTGMSPVKFRQSITTK